MSTYIHYHFNNYLKEHNSNENDATAFLYKQFSDQIIKRQYIQSEKNLKNKLTKIFLPEVQKYNLNPIGEEEFFSILNELQNNVLQSAATKMTSELTTTGIGYKDISDALYKTKDLQTILNKFKDTARQITGGTFSKNPIPILTIEHLNGNINADNIKETFYKAYINDQTTFKVDNSYSRAIASHKNEINKILANLSAIEAIQDGALKNLNISQQIKSKTISKLIYSIWATINRMVGFVSEDRLAENIPLFLDDYLKDCGIVSDVKPSGTEKGSIFKVQTEDISINFDLQKMLKTSQSGNISVKMPGITLKRTNIKPNNIAKIHIKSGALLSNFLDNIKIDSKKLQTFYQAYATYNMSIMQGKKKEKAQLPISAKPAMQNMYSFFHASFLPLALAGSLDKNDFAYFMIINDKVYNVLEIITKVGDIKDPSFVTSDLSNHQNSIKNLHNQYFLNSSSSQERSNKIFDAIQKTRINMELQLKI